LVMDIAPRGVVRKGGRGSALIPFGKASSAVGGNRAARGRKCVINRGGKEHVITEEQALVAETVRRGTDHRPPKTSRDKAETSRTKGPGNPTVVRLRQKEAEDKAC